MHHYDYVYFCSAYNDVSHILAFIERDTNARHLIIVVNIHQCFKFLKTLQTKNSDVLFIESKLKKPKQLLQWIYEWNNLKQIRLNILNQIVGSKVVFFSSFYDLLGCSCINLLKDKNAIFLSIPIEKDFKLTKRKILDVMYSALYGVRFETFSYINRKVSGLPLSYLNLHVKQDIQADENELIAVRKKFSRSLTSDVPYILMLDADVNFEGLTNSGEEAVEKLFNLLRKFNTVVKGHPRLGLSQVTVRYEFHEIESFIPIEFIDFSMCQCVVGCWSIALANIANMGVKSISLLKLLPYADEKLRQSRINYLKQYAPSKILYPTTLEELEKELTTSFQ